MKIKPVKLCHERWSKCIQHIKAVKLITKAAARKFRRDTRRALKLGNEPPITFTGGDRY
jgi:hypothetical protein